MNAYGQNFGGDWTIEKLERVRKYLVAYATIMNKQHFSFSYIDAFAGTGYRTLKKRGGDNELLLPELAETESQKFLDGSVRIALRVEPKFGSYLFIEKGLAKAKELEKLKNEFESIKDRIEIINKDANTYIAELCAEHWKRRRAVMFLDPFGMQVTWGTIELIAKTQAIDLWILFPIGATNRLLKRDGNIDDKWKEKLDTILGETTWYDAFYEMTTTRDLFGEVSLTTKTGDFGSIKSYFVERLKTVFPGVAKNPLLLRNNKNVPLFLLCFACGNEKGAPIAIKIAQDILKH